MADPEVEPFVLRDPNDDYLKKLTAAGYAVFINKLTRNDDPDGPPTEEYQALIIDEAEYTGRLREVNAERFIKWNKLPDVTGGHMGMPKTPKADFEQLKELELQHLQADPRVYIAPTALAALEGAMRNLFDLGYDAAA